MTHVKRSHGIKRNIRIHLLCTRPGKILTGANWPRNFARHGAADTEGEGGPPQRLAEQPLVAWLGGERARGPTPLNAAACAACLVWEAWGIHLFGREMLSYPFSAFRRRPQVMGCMLAAPEEFPKSWPVCGKFLKNCAKRYSRQTYSPCA